MKPKVLIICDYRDTVYDMISNAFMNETKASFEFKKIYSGDNPIFNHRDYDVIYCLWWRSELLEKIDIPREKLCIQVASFWSWQNKFKTSLDDLVSKYLLRAGTISVNCPGLYNVIYPLHNGVFHNPAGVDVSLFHEFSRKSNFTDKPLVVGWAGNSRTHDNNKGLYDLIIPTCQNLPNVVLKVCDWDKEYIPHNEMPNFYKDIDAYICTSISEGTPNPVLEAASCGRAVISTMVGIVPMLVRDGLNGLVIERNRESLQNAIIKLRDDRDLCITMGKKNSEIIRNEGWCWTNRAKGYEKMFFCVANRAGNGL